MEGAHARGVDTPQDRASGAPAGGDAATNRAVYEAIAAAFDASRGAPWPVVARFLATQPPGLLLDLAAGNARHARLAARHGHRAVAVDVARSLLERGRAHARAEGLPLACVVADMARLPFPRDAFPLILFVAAIHCVRGRAARRAVLQELHRVAAPDAPALVTAWERDEERFGSALRRGTDPPGEPGDVIVPWTHQVEKSVPRFFHLYAADELEADLMAAGFRDVSVRREQIGASGTWNLIATPRA